MPVLADALIQPDKLIQQTPVQPLIIATGATRSKNGVSFKTKIIRSPPADENKKTELTKSLVADSNTALPDIEIIVVAGPSIDEPSPPGTEITAPPEFIIINEEIVAADDLGVTKVQSDSVAPKHFSLAPSSVSEVCSQNVEKLMSVKGRIGKRIFRCKYVNDYKLPEWLPENQLPRQLVEEFFVKEDSKRVLRTSLLEKARELRPQVEEKSNPHATRSKNSTVETS